MTDDQIIDRVLVEEGGFVNHPDDAGGPTKFGITQAVLAASRGGPVAAVDVEQLSLTEAREILRDLYIKQPGYDGLGSDTLRAAVVDYAVNSGPAQATRDLQRVLGLPVDGICGPATCAAANLKTGEYLALRLIAERMRLLGHLITRDHTQAVFAEGWANRVAEQLEAAIP